jgi:hypothetical protein
LDISTLQEYARLVVDNELGEEEKESLITSMCQFPLFTMGMVPGTVSFTHEIMAEYLAGNFYLERITAKPVDVARKLSVRIDFGDSFIAQHMSKALTGNTKALAEIERALQYKTMPGLSFATLLQLYMLVTEDDRLFKDAKLNLEGKDLRGVRFQDMDISGNSFRNANLAGAVFDNCSLRNADFAGAVLLGTTFRNLNRLALYSAKFGNLNRFEYVISEGRKLDKRTAMINWLANVTGEEVQANLPCPAALQLRELWRKYINPDGSGRRDSLPGGALMRGRQHPQAPSPQECLEASISSGFLKGADYRERYRRAGGNQYKEMVDYIRDWQLSSGVSLLLNSLCSISGCQHV